MRTALVAWLLARKQGARFTLRFEDLDPQRSRRQWEAAQVAGLQATGIDWDEPPVRQSERLALYADALARLREQDLVYPCFCTRAEIRAAASAPHDDELPDGAYPGTCLALTAAERRRRIEAGAPYALRLRAQHTKIEFVDRLLGPRWGIVDDFVLVRADGVYAYQLAVVVDDAAQGIGEVCRGADLASSTPRQILLQDLLGLPQPSYLHVPLVLTADGKRLAKRHQGAAFADVREQPGAMLTLLAHSLGLARERNSVHAAGELLDEFDPALIPTAPLTLPAAER
jgi:glutamyl-tRNA synthetase